MQWGSPAEFFAMGGYGFFVWGSFGVTAVCMFLEPWITARRHRNAVISAVNAQSWKEAER